MIAQLNEENIRDIIHFLEEKDFFASEDDLRSALRERSHCTIEDRSSMLRLDLKGIYLESDKQTLERRMPVKWRGETIYISSPEDLIANKLLFGSEQDIKDAEGIWIRQTEELDNAYLEERCRALEVWSEFLEMKVKIEGYLNEIKKGTEIRETRK